MLKGIAMVCVRVGAFLAGASASVTREEDSSLNHVRDQDGDQESVHHAIEPAPEHLQLRTEEELAHDQADENDREHLIYHAGTVAFVGVAGRMAHPRRWKLHGLGDNPDILLGLMSSGTGYMLALTAGRDASYAALPGVASSPN